MHYPYIIPTTSTAPPPPRFGLDGPASVSIFSCRARHAPHAVEWLSDNGSPFTARETLDFAAALGLVPCFTPVQSSESNGIDARVHPLLDAATVLRQIAGWFDDYNESHPHSGLGMISPREFIRAQAR
jgi:putative transposase